MSPAGRRIALAGVVVVTACLVACGIEAEHDYAWGVAAYEEGDYARALALWRPLAEKGLGRAERNLGVMYYFGQGVPQDYARALALFRASAEQGTGNVALKLSLMLAEGQGTERDLVEAYKWARVAMEDGGPEAEQWQASLAGRMTAEQIAAGQARADAWKPVR